MRGTSSRRLAIAGVVLSLASSVVVGIMTPAMAAPSGTTQVGAVQPAQLAVQLGTTHVEKAATQIHSVVPGDTLSGIAPRYNTTWPNLYNANTSIIRDPNLIYVGQRLTVPSGQVSKNPPAPAPAPVAAAAPATGKYANPLPGACLGSAYGEWRGTYSHQGWDLPAGHGTPIRALTNARVHSARWEGGGGNTIILNHGDGSYSIYMHQSSFAVSPGQWVSAGQTIGYVGNTGDSHGAHLHLEVRWGGPWGSTVNPVQFLRDRGVRLGC